jgi:hypothetical protein
MSLPSHPPWYVTIQIKKINSQRLIFRRHHVFVLRSYK